MRDLIAITSHNVGTPINGGGTGLDDGSGDPTSTLANIISTVIGLLTVLAAIYFMYVLITGAISIITSGGDKGAYEDARKKITTGLIGLVIVISAIFIMRLASTFLGIPNILDLGEMISTLRL